MLLLLLLFRLDVGDGDLDSRTGCIGTGNGGLLRHRDFFRSIMLELCIGVYIDGESFS